MVPSRSSKPRRSPICPFSFFSFQRANGEGCPGWDALHSFWSMPPFGSSSWTLLRPPCLAALRCNRRFRIFLTLICGLPHSLYIAPGLKPDRCLRWGRSGEGDSTLSQRLQLPRRGLPWELASNAPEVFKALKDCACLLAATKNCVVSRRLYPRLVVAILACSIIKALRRLVSCDVICLSTATGIASLYVRSITCSCSVSFLRTIDPSVVNAACRLRYDAVNHLL